MYVGYDNDTYRSTNAAFGVPRVDTSNVVQYTFGSSHPAGFNVVLCDGSGRSVSYTIDMTVYGMLGNRSDGKVMPNY